MQNTCCNTQEDTTFVHVISIHMYLILLLFYIHLFSHYKSADKMNDKHVEIKCQLDATEVFIADLIACSTCFGHHYAHHQELKSII